MGSIFLQEFGPFSKTAIFIGFGVFLLILAVFKLEKLKKLDQHEICCQI